MRTETFDRDDRLLLAERAERPECADSVELVVAVERVRIRGPPRVRTVPDKGLLGWLITGRKVGVRECPSSGDLKVLAGKSTGPTDVGVADPVGCRCLDAYSWASVTKLADTAGDAADPAAKTMVDKDAPMEGERRHVSGRFRVSEDWEGVVHAGLLDVDRGEPGRDPESEVFFFFGERYVDKLKRLVPELIR